MCSSVPELKGESAINMCATSPSYTLFKVPILSISLKRSKILFSHGCPNLELEDKVPSPSKFQVVYQLETLGPKH